MKKHSLFLFMLFTSCGLLNSFSVQAVSEKNINVFTSLVKEHLIANSDMPINTTELSAERTRWIVETRLDPKVMDNKTIESGVSLQFIPAHSTYYSNISLLELVYPDATIAARIREKLAKGNYFKNSKILTLFSCVQDNNQVLIIFTESAGDSQIAAFIEDFSVLWRNKIDEYTSSQL